MRKKAQKNDTSKHVSQKSKIKNKIDIKIRCDLTNKQKDLIDILTKKETKIVFLIGPAGTSKTYTAILSSLILLNNKKISDILYVRTAVESSDAKLGFLPGEASDKMTPYMQPLMDKLEELLTKNDIDKLKKDNRIDGMPINYLRGLSWNSKCIIADEAQNLTINELITLITRIGEFTKIFICADPDQSDINNKSGILKLVNLFNDNESKKHNILTYNFTEDDVVRSGICKFILQKIKNINK